MEKYPLKIDVQTNYFKIKINEGAMRAWPKEITIEGKVYRYQKESERE